MTNYLLLKHKQIRQLGLLLVVLLLCSGMSAQMTVSGKVTDNSGPVPGASVILKGTTNGAATDFDGNYTIKNVPSNGVLIFSYLGYKTKEVQVNNLTKIDVVLEYDSSTLDEIVVIGYGTQRKKL